MSVKETWNKVNYDFDHQDGVSAVGAFDADSRPFLAGIGILISTLLERILRERDPSVIR